MSGSLRGDFSRLGFDARKRDSAVHLQQGRVLLDSDWNALVDLLNYRLRSQARDLLGPSGAPQEGAGFKITASSSLRFDGRSRYALLGEEPVPLYSRLEATTLELTIRPREGGAGGTFLSRFERSQMDEYRVPRYRLAVEEDGRLALHPSGLAVSRLLSREPVVAGRWAHVALTHDAGACRLYLDGRLAAEAEPGFQIAGAGAVFLLGLAQIEGGHPPGFDGALGEMRIWDRALDAAVIARLAEDGPGEGDDGLAGEWRFPDAADGRVPDRSGNGNDALLRSLTEEAAPGLELEELRIAAGRYYVDGILCENERDVPFDAQPELPGATPPPVDRDGDYLFYLDVWERFVTALQDPELFEAALGGGDTSARSRVVAQVRWMPLGAGGDEAPTVPADALASPPRGGLWARRPPEAAGELGNSLYRVEIHTGGGVYGWPRQATAEEIVDLEQVEADGRLVLESRHPAGPELAVGDWVELFSDETDRAGEPGPLARVEALEPGTTRLTLGGPIDRLAAHHHLRLRPIATFKWSRENGSVIMPIRHLDPGSAVARLGRTCPGRPPLSVGDWVEVSDDRAVLSQRTTPLLRIDALDPLALTVTLSAAPSGVGGDPAEHPIVRRWDHRDGAVRTVDGVIPVNGDGAIELENGIEIGFTGGGAYRRGDYWTFPSRAHSGEIGWPRDDQGAPAERPPEGVDHHAAPLATLRIRDGRFSLVDCRRTFRPSTEDAVSRGGDRMHGPLSIEPATTGPHALTVIGVARAEILEGQLGSEAAVATANITAGAVTADKLAPEVGTVPPGHAVLGDSPEPPPGYAYTGCCLQMPVPEPAWESRFEIEQESAGELVSAVIGRSIYTLSDTGRLWSYDVDQRRVEALEPSPEPRCGFAMAEAYGKLYLFGGVDEAGRKAAATFEYDPTTGVWSDRAPLPTPRRDAAVANVDGDLYVIGGLRDLGFLEVVSGRTEVYDPVSDSWVRRRALPAPTFGSAAAAGRRTIYLFGGQRKWFLRWLGRGLSGRGRVYLPGLDRWSPAANLPAPRTQAGATALAGKMFVVGGRSFLGWMGETVVYSPQGDAWGREASSPPAPCRPGLAAIDGRLVLQTAGAANDTIEIREMALFHSFYVHRKTGPGDGDVPRLALDEEV